MISVNKNCPFCTNVPMGIARVADQPFNERWAICCIRCGARGPWVQDPNLAWAVWNNRPNTQRPVSQESIGEELDD